MKNSQCSGFTLVELAISLIIISLIMGFFMSAGSAFIGNQNTKSVETKLQAISNAMAAFVAVHGRLPCPADGSLTAASATVGNEVRASGACTGNQINGVVPWVSIGLAEADVTDAWSRRITYRVSPNLVVDSGMDMTSCDPAGTGTASGTNSLCNSGCTGTLLASCTPPSAFLAANKGLSIKTDNAAAGFAMDASTTPSNGAAYVLISHGPDQGGGFSFGGGSVSGHLNSGTNEQVNRNGVVLATYYIDGQRNENSGAAHFDDLVLRPSIMTVIMQAQRGARTH